MRETHLPKRVKACTNLFGGHHTQILAKEHIREIPHSVKMRAPPSTAPLVGGPCPTENIETRIYSVCAWSPTKTMGPIQEGQHPKTRMRQRQISSMKNASPQRAKIIYTNFVDPNQRGRLANFLSYYPTHTTSASPAACAAPEGGV